MIVPMKRLTLVALKSDEEGILSALQSIAAVQVISSTEAVSDDAALAKLEARVQRLDSVAAILRPYAEKGKLGPKPEATVQELTLGLPPALELCEKVEEVDHALSALKSDMDKRRALIESLQPWSELEAKIPSIKSSETVKYLTGMIPPEGLEKLTQTPAAIEVYGGEKEKAVLIACLSCDYPEVIQVLKGVGFADFAFPPLSGTPRENIVESEEKIAALKVEETELTARLTELAKQRTIVCRALDAAVIHRDREAVKGGLSATQTAFVLEGWVREDETEKLEKAVSAVTPTYYLDCRAPEEEETEPVVLKNTPLVKPYEAVTNLYSLPAPGTVDATPLFMPFYFIFFGMMLSDTAYGLVLFLGAFLFKKLMKPTGMMADLCGVLEQGGISTIFMGLLFGTIAGVSWPVIFKGLPFENVFPLIDSSSNPIAMLVVCAGFGLIHMFYGVLIATSRCIKQGDWWGAIIDNFCWLLIVTGLLLLAAPMLGLPAALGAVGKWMAIVAAAAVFLFAGRGKKNIAGRLVSGAGKLYDITAWLGDVLSYARIFALGLSSGVIGLVLNTLCWGMLFESFKGNIVLTIIGFIITAALSIGLHLFMMAISTLGCFVHTARLQYVEFFGKFYEAGGKPFQPLGYKTKHVRVSE